MEDPKEVILITSDSEESFVVHEELESNLLYLNKVRSIHDLSDSDDSRKCIKSQFKQRLKVKHVLSDSEDSDQDSHRSTECLSKKTKNKAKTSRKVENGDILLLKEQKRRKKEEEKKKKLERQAALKQQRQLKPGECIKYMNIILDSSILSFSFGTDLISSLQNFNCKYQLETQDIPLCIKWIRHLPDTDPVEESQILLVWQWEEFIESVSKHSLCEDIRLIQQKLPGKFITLVIYSIDGYFNFLKNKRKKMTNKSEKKESQSDIKIVTRGEMELALTELQIIINCNHRLVNTSQELSLLIYQFTKSISEIPFKKQKQKRDENLEWFAAGDSRDCVRIDKDGNGLLRLWQQQLCQFNLATFDTAQAIASFYPSPQSLIKAYDECLSQKDAELLLQNIPIRRCQGPLSSARRIGPELSKKIYKFFNNTDGNCHLSNN